MAGPVMVAPAAVLGLVLVDTGAHMRGHGARSSVHVASVEVGFYDGWGAETNHSEWVAVNKALAAGHGYTVDTAVNP